MNWMIKYVGRWISIRELEVICLCKKFICWDKKRKYNIDIEDANEYGRYFSKLDKSDLVEEEQDASSVNFENSSIQLTNDKYTLTLLADFENDTYLKKYLFLQKM